MRPYIDASDLFRQQWAAIIGKHPDLSKYATLDVLMENLRNLWTISGSFQEVCVRIGIDTFKVSVLSSKKPNGQWSIQLKEIVIAQYNECQDCTIEI